MPGPGSAQRWAAAAGRWGCRLLALLLLLLVPGPGGASEITFELPDNAKQCFYEDITQGTKCTLEFQVITGGHYDVDCRLEDPDGNVLYKEMKKQYDSFTFTASKNGTYKFCFSNEFSTFTHKTVYFDFQVGEDPPLFPSENRVSALTQMESACVSIHEALKSVIDYQTHFRLREAQGRSRAEDLNTRVAYWSVGEALILLVVSIGQVFLLKSFFSDKRTTTTRVGWFDALRIPAQGRGRRPQRRAPAGTSQGERQDPGFGQARGFFIQGLGAPVGDGEAAAAALTPAPKSVPSKHWRRPHPPPPTQASGDSERRRRRRRQQRSERASASVTVPLHHCRSSAPSGPPSLLRRGLGGFLGAAAARPPQRLTAEVCARWGEKADENYVISFRSAKQVSRKKERSPFLTGRFTMGVRKSKIDPRPLSVSWGQSPGVEVRQSRPESDSKRPEDLSLRALPESGPTTLRPAGQCEAAMGLGERTPGEEEEEEEEEVFLKFVILHAEDDTDEALRVQSLLQNDFGIRPGIIFAEMPCGRQHLQNLDDAVNGSAWTILLLTENFLRDTWCKFQFYTSLMNSVNRRHKYNSVIPMRPLNKPLPRERTPFALRTINALEEDSRGFPTQVERIFQESVYKIQQSVWREARSSVQRHFVS
nr:uncharacterized protein LOC112932456 [Vulpes vulpes]